MGGGLLQLVAYGAQDVYLTGNPQITFFKVVYRRHTNFALESIQQTFNGTAGFNNTITCTVSRNGDLINRVYVEMDLPQIVELAKHNNVNQSGLLENTQIVLYKNYVGLQLLKNVVVEIGGQQIDKQYSDWMYIWNELSLPDGKRDGYNKMVGENGLDLSKKENNKLFVPLEFWFCRNVGLALPLIALQYHEVKFKIEFASLSDVTVEFTTDGTGSIPASLNEGSTSIQFPNVNIWVDYIYLDTDERRKFAQLSHEYLIEQLQFSGAEEYKSQLRLNFNHPVKELVWVYNDAANWKWNDFSNNDANPFDTAHLKLNGNDRFAKREGKYFDVVLLSYSGGNSGGGFSYSREEVFPTHLGTEIIEGRWILPMFEGDPGNTMYEFIDGLRYTYYCAQDSGCDAAYWNSLDTTDALPTVNPYTVDENTISIDLHFGNMATYTMDFRCDGKLVDFYYDEDDSWEGLHSTMSRVGYDTSQCEELNSFPISGRWLWGYGFHPLASTMHELIDGTMYTYYCTQDSGCDATDWDLLDTSDAIPNPDFYTFTNDTLTINDGPGAHVNFECNGNIAIFNDNTVSYWWRVGLDTTECEGFFLDLPSTSLNPNTFRLNQNYPNPFNPTTNLSYELSDDSYVTITVYDLLGNVVRNLVSENQSSGIKSVQWDATNEQGQSVAAGVYLYRIESGSFTNTKKNDPS